MSHKIELERQKGILAATQKAKARQEWLALHTQKGVRTSYLTKPVPAVAAVPAVPAVPSVAPPVVDMGENAINAIIHPEVANTLITSLF